MRHVGSVLLSLLLAPVIWILVGAGINRYSPGELSLLDGRPRTIFGLLALLTAGGLYALLVLVRLSPAGPGLTGVLYLGASLWAGLAPGGWLAVMPDSALGAHGAVEDPAAYAGLLLAVPLVSTLFSGRRWRGYDHVRPGSFASWPPPRTVAAPTVTPVTTVETPPWPPVPGSPVPSHAAIPPPRRPQSGF